MSEKLLVVVHSGSFHADDVGSIAVLRSCFDFEVVRTRDEDTINRANYVVDVGGKYNPELGQFDHHQKNTPEPRLNGIPYAALGLVWKEFGARVCGDNEVADIVDRLLIQAIDANDNGFELFESSVDGIRISTISEIIGDMNPVTGEEATVDFQFNMAVTMFEVFLNRVIAKAKNIVYGRGVVRKAVQNSGDKKIVTLDEHVPWKETIIKESPETLYILYETNEKWRISCVPPEADSFENKKSLPKEWGGLRDTDLQKITGINDVKFVHKNLFTGGAGSYEGVMKMAKLAIID